MLGNRVLEKMLKEVGSAQSFSTVRSLADELGRSEAQVRRYIEATAEVCRAGQAKLLQSVLAYIRSLPEFVKPVCFTHHEALDETPLRIRVAFSDIEGHGVSQLAKIYAVESEWSILLEIVPFQQIVASHSSTHDQTHREYLLIHGCWSPRLAAADSSNAYSIASVMRDSPRPPPEVSEMFPLKLRLQEWDEAGANLKAQRLFQSTLPDWHSIEWYCSAHKAHSVAEKVLGLAKPTLTGIIYTLLCLRGAQQLLRLEFALTSLVKASLIIRPMAPLSEATKAYRRAILKQFLPLPSVPKQRGTVLALCSLLNGDWRTNELEHYCSGPPCCTSKQDSQDKVISALLATIRCCKPSRLCRDNWLEWRRPINIVALLTYIHAMLPQAFPVAFPTKKQKQDMKPTGPSKRHRHILTPHALESL